MSKGKKRSWAEREIQRRVEKDNVLTHFEKSVLHAQANQEKFSSTADAITKMKESLAQQILPLQKHNHGEAFALMTYECADLGTTRTSGPNSVCGHREIYWNSRDGVTPFGMSCPSCGGSLYHLNWKLDVYAPDHKPHPGQGVFRDGTLEEAVAITRKQIESRKGTEYERTEEEIEQIVNDTRSSYGELHSGWREGWPKFYRHKEDEHA